MNQVRPVYVTVATQYNKCFRQGKLLNNPCPLESRPIIECSIADPRITINKLYSELVVEARVVESGLVDFIETTLSSINRNIGGPTRSRSLEVFLESSSAVPSNVNGVDP